MRSPQYISELDEPNPPPTPPSSPPPVPSSINPPGPKGSNGGINGGGIGASSILSSS